MNKPTTVLLLAAMMAAAVHLRAADAPERATVSLQGEAARPAAAQWMRSELYFGLGLDGASTGAGVTEAQWREFLDREVTPRFPDGLTVFDAYGQWLGRNAGRPSRLRTKVLVILHEDSAERRAAIDAIRLAWKSATHDRSVLLVSQRADVSF